MDPRSQTFFRDILATMLAESKLNQLSISMLTGLSESQISRVSNGSRVLQPKLAGQLAEIFGGTQEIWLKTYQETVGGSGESIAFYRNLLGIPNKTPERLITTQPHNLGRMENDLVTTVRRMSRSDIIHVFSNEDGKMSFRDTEEYCEIEGFDSSRARQTSYDTCVGGLIDRDSSDIQKFVEIRDEIIIAPSESELVIVKEHITLPSWIEAELHPASNIAMKGLMVSHGPIIDPGWSGRLVVSIFNPCKNSVAITTDEPFLTLRFWIHEDR